MRRQRRRRREERRPADTPAPNGNGRKDGAFCPTCGCRIHAVPHTWEATCSVCEECRWPYAVALPDPYVCYRCRTRRGGPRG